MLTFLDGNVISLIAVALALIVVILASAVLGVRFFLHDLRLPAAVRLAELDGLVGAKEEHRRYLDEEIAKRERALSERDTAEAEAEHWRSLMESAKAEYELLGPQRQEIEAFREEYRQAVEDAEAAKSDLREARATAEEERSRHRALVERINQQADEFRAIEARREALNQEVADQTGALERLEKEIAAAKEAHTAIAGEVEQSRLRHSALKNDIETYERQAMRLEERHIALDREIETVRRDIENLDPERTEVTKLSEQRKDLERECHKLRDEKDILTARIARLREEAGTTGESSGPGEVSVLADLRTVPACLAASGKAWPQGTWERGQHAENEGQALDRVAKFLEDSGLVFPRRTINAFHTSLKTAVISPLTVLAGISGTGKSQLPRRYADAMGLHFLKIPVQPRWDSPQDLFGFYNYIERRYKATDLARALIHLDEYNWKEESEIYKDHMLMVLLDEMNLARVEYYFSEFLSRLEGRPTDANAHDEQERRPSEIDVDIPRSGQPYRVYAGQNVLFVGTMNEDESTLALSDKVLDRANVLRFPRPRELKDTIPVITERNRAGGFLPRGRWSQKWIRWADSLSSSSKERATNTIDQINDAMDQLGRPFGHRMGQAMLHYVANYPGSEDRIDNTLAVEHGLADQIEQRILPRLRGLDVSVHREALAALVRIAGGTLRDELLGNAIDRAIRSSEALGMFNWRGFTRTGG